VELYSAGRGRRWYMVLDTIRLPGTASMSAFAPRGYWGASGAAGNASGGSGGRGVVMRRPEKRPRLAIHTRIWG